MADRGAPVALARAATSPPIRTSWCIDPAALSEPPQRICFLVKLIRPAGRFLSLCLAHRQLEQDSPLHIHIVPRNAVTLCLASLSRRLLCALDISAVAFRAAGGLYSFSSRWRLKRWSSPVGSRGTVCRWT